MQTVQVESAANWQKEYGKPVVYDECCYEGNLPQPWGNISGFEMVNRFWIAGVQGAYTTHGEVFLDENDILWWAKGGVLKGQSPARIAFFKNFIDSLPGQPGPWDVNPLEGMDPAMIEKILNSPFVTLPQKMPEWQQNSNFVKETDFRGRCGSDVFLQYLGHHCNGLLHWHLPEDEHYRIEVIDVWEMTLHTVMDDASGAFDISLPGKEGIAVVGWKKEK